MEDDNLAPFILDPYQKHRLPVSRPYIITVVRSVCTVYIIVIMYAGHTWAMYYTIWFLSDFLFSLELIIIFGFTYIFG